jgi:carboxypeptidase C (cathepsin A)
MGNADAFYCFLRTYLLRYQPWRSPLFLFGESYGAPREAALSTIWLTIAFPLMAW